MTPINPLRVKLNSTSFSISTTSFIGLFFLFILLSFSMAGCVTFDDPEASQVQNINSIASMDSITSLGQTFTSRRPNFNGITLWITPITDKENLTSNAEQNILTLQLFASLQDDTPIYSTSLWIPKSGNNLPINIKIPNQKNPANEDYFIQLSSTSGKVQINGRNEDSYPYGQAYIDNQPINADIAFRLSYEYDIYSLVHDITQGISSAWLVFPVLIVIILPGGLLLDITGLRSRFDIGEQIALSIGISLGLIPILMLWTTLLNIKITGNSVLFMAGFLIILFIGRVIYLTIHTNNNAWNKSMHSVKEFLKNRSSIYKLVIPILLVLIFLCTLTIRLIMVRDLATPAWVDSVHHALITRQILVNGAYPSSYQPYWDMDPTAYHPGFHSILAIFTWLSKLSIDRAMLFLGQVLNACAIFSVYLFTKILTKSQLSGLFAAMITGFLTPMPAYYTSWGRYTELTGLLILPAAFTLILVLLEGKINLQKYWIALLCALILGGLFMVHYRVTAFLGCLIISYCVIYLMIHKAKPSTTSGLGLLFISIVIAIFFVFPWVIQAIKSTFLPMIKSTDVYNVIFFQDFSWVFLTSAYGKQTLLLAGLGILWGMIERKRFPYLILLWIVLLFMLANLNALHLPGGDFINNLSVEIMLFIPISVLGGYFIDQILIRWNDLTPVKLRIPIMGIFLIVSLVVIYNGSKQLVTILNPITILSRNADLMAIDWVRENIPQDETLVINPFLWGYGLYAGGDGGFWIAPLTGRITLPPPILYGLGNEREKIIEEVQNIEKNSAIPIALWKYMNTKNLHYVFIGARGGVLSPEKMLNSGLFSPLYQKDGVWIFNLKSIEENITENLDR